MSANGKGAYNRPCSGFMHREGKPEGFFCLDRRTVDSKHDIITDIFATPGNTNDVKPYLGRLGVQIDKLGFDVKYVGLDAGYSILNICKYLYDMGIQAAMGHHRFCNAECGRRITSGILRAVVHREALPAARIRYSQHCKRGDGNKMFCAYAFCCPTEYRSRCGKQRLLRRYGSQRECFRCDYGFFRQNLRTML